MPQPQSGFKNYPFSIKKSIAALVSGAAILFWSCENNIEKIKAFSSPEELPVISAIGFETTFTDSGQVRFNMKAAQLLRYETDGKPFNEFPKGIYLAKFDENKNIISKITADYAKQFDKEQRWEAKNNVIAINASGDTLKTEQLNWDEKTGRITSDKYVKIIRTDQIMTGIGFEADQNMENWIIKNPKGTLYIEVNNEQGAASPASDSALQENTMKPALFESP